MESGRSAANWSPNSGDSPVTPASTAAIQRARLTKSHAPISAWPSADPAARLRPAAVSKAEQVKGCLTNGRSAAARAGGGGERESTPARRGGEAPRGAVGLQRRVLPRPTEGPRRRDNELACARRPGERSPAPRRRHELASRPRRRGSRRPPASSTQHRETAGAERATPARRAGGRPPGRDPNAHRRRASQSRRVRTNGRSRARRSPTYARPLPPRHVQRRVLSAPRRRAATAGQRAGARAAPRRAEPNPTPAPRAGEPPETTREHDAPRQLDGAPGDGRSGARDARSTGWCEDRSDVDLTRTEDVHLRVGALERRGRSRARRRRNLQPPASPASRAAAGSKRAPPRGRDGGATRRAVRGARASGAKSCAGATSWRARPRRRTGTRPSASSTAHWETAGAGTETPARRAGERAAGTCPEGASPTCNSA